MKEIILEEDNNYFEFIWETKDGLKKIPEELFLYCLELVNKNRVYLKKNLDDNKRMQIITLNDCNEYRMFNIQNNNYIKETPKSSLLKRYTNRDISICANPKCRLDFCPIEIAAYIFYLRKTNQEEKINQDREYYNNHKEEIDSEIKLLREERSSKQIQKKDEYLNDFKVYNVKNLEVLIDSLLNKQQTNLYCTVESEDKILNDKFISQIKNTLIRIKKIDNFKEISLLNLSSENLYEYSGLPEKSKKEERLKDCNGVYYYTKSAMISTQLNKGTFYVVNEIDEFVSDYNEYKEKHTSSTRFKQFQHMIELLVDLTKDNYIVLNGTKQSIDKLFEIDSRIKFVYNNRFELPDISLDEMFDLYLAGIKGELFEQIKKEVEKYKKKFNEYVSLNKNFLPFSNRELVNYLVIYSNSQNKIIFPENIYKKETIEESLENIIGLKNVKEKVKEFEKLMIFKLKAESYGIKIQNTNMHMIFSGNPGTGKTTIARIMAKMLYDLGIIRQNKLVEVEAKDLIGSYVGQTAPKTSKVIDSAIGGVLFIDEAYTLANDNKNQSYGKEAIATLIKAMEDRKGEFVVIFAGYTKEMEEFININPGIASRIGYNLKFEDYNAEELAEIYYKKVNIMNMKLTDDAKKKVLDIMKYFVDVENIGNGRFADRLIQETIIKHAQNNSEDIQIIKEDDIPLIKDITKILFNGDYMIDPNKITIDELRKTAVHEIGHAVMRLLLYKESGIKKITINSEGTGALGYVRYKDKEGKYTASKEELLNYIRVAMAGIASEKLYYGFFENGGTSDLKKATRIADNMITKYGMSKNGYAVIYDESKKIAMAKNIQDEINEILDNCFEYSYNKLKENKEKLDKVVDFLIEHREIDEEELIENFK